MSGKLAIRRVRRYRVARYPSRHPAAKRAGSIGRRALRAAAAPAVALGLGAAGGACDGGVNLLGVGEDVVDEAEAAADAEARDVRTFEVAPADAGADEAAAEDTEPDYIMEGDMAPGAYYTRYLTEAQGRALIREVIDDEASVPSGPCDIPLAERVLEDQPFTEEVEGGLGVDAGIDLLAPAWIPPCVRGMAPPAGFEFMTDEAEDDEDVSGNPWGLTDLEEMVLGELRDRGEAGIVPIRSADYPYGVWEYEDGWIDDSDRARAEELVRATTRALLDDLRRDGFI